MRRVRFSDSKAKGTSGNQFSISVRPHTNAKCVSNGFGVGYSSYG